MASARQSIAKPRKAGAKRAGPGRPPLISDERLLEVAREVFLERGIRATTLEVAQRAGASEGVVFHRFKSKDALFRAAMRFEARDLPGLLLTTLQTEAEKDLEIRETLIRIASVMIELGRVALPLLMMSWSNPNAGPIHSAEEHSGFREVIKHFASYFEAKMSEGKLRRVDAEILARTFMGATHHYCLTQLFAEETGVLPMPEGMYIRGLVDLLLTGAEPEEAASAPPSAWRRARR
jgi:AcrR family transcriptional regulator